MESEDTEQEMGGDPPCWAHLVCPECGAFETGQHREGCPLEHPEDLASGPAAQE